uniref:Uncharacterized protein n=1 Tax=Plectus sambesii TaxID=2011161 RepID=A0A914WD17_9BILA
MVPNERKNMPSRSKDHRSCCNCCHIKHGTALMGLLEMAIVCVLIFFTVDRLIKRHETQGQCFSSFFANCRFNVSISKLDITLTGDYISAALMCLIVLAIMLLFYGIYSTNAKLLLPHIILQGLCLIFSLLYFFAYAWAYFYDDLYVHQRPFQWKSFFERMWLASILLVLSCFQFYLFFIVLHCAIYLQAVRAARIRKQQQWSESSAKSARKFSSNAAASPHSARNSTASAISLPAPASASPTPKRSSLETTRSVSPLIGQGAGATRVNPISPLAANSAQGGAVEAPSKASPHHHSHHAHRQPHASIVKRISDESMASSLTLTPPPIPRIRILTADGSMPAPVKKVSISAVPSIRSYDPDR